MAHRCVIELSCLMLLLFDLSPYLYGEVDPKTVLVHYMPWYSSKSVSGRWGWHWTMDCFDPEKIKSRLRIETSKFKPFNLDNKIAKEAA